MPETDTHQDEADLTLLETAAREAGALALTYFGRDPRTWLKGNKSPVSEADLAVDTLLASRLRESRPEYGWLSEETVDDKRRLDQDRVFIVDPIDGTRAFLAGGEEWTVSVAVVDRGRPVAGAVFCPRRDEMFLARAKGGCRLNGETILVSKRADVQGSRLTGPHSIVSAEAVRASGFEPQEILRSLAYRIANVACGRVEVAAARGGPSDWDLAAADLLVQEAGGKLSGLDGQSMIYNREKTRHPALIAAPAALLEAATAVLGDVIR
ncbi:3'(2'),5'-bisphosphate nucleotidase CysQ [Roseibium denhamense]|uniref:Myo-inositol-1(Or 4)-monophosphatase n=1 Tax=Roseibium denhamense TaxID=76305 RepID=A0ABY1P3R4_9HYPH|nr:3'(2'),5'-bisphosphate nucleotidase CysQ [Roseibium denhamense]MTI07708.1 3'(2'),5'-bisphosphate nucleotidase CysQ [Roseibium denhamense]SMP24776.1 myo-inositol-1(or 4)-monophosphatase [Roseibium denhamense]